MVVHNCHEMHQLHRATLDEHYSPTRHDDWPTWNVERFCELQLSS